MIKTKTLFALTITAVAIIGAALVVERQDSVDAPSMGAAQALLPELNAHINDIARISLHSGQQQVTLTHADKTWSIVERGNYPADEGKLRAFVLNVAGLTIVEPKTGNKELLNKLGLDDPTKDNSEATRIVFSDSKDQVIADVIVGKQRPGKGNQERSEHYARKGDDNQSWLVAGTLQLQKQPRDWLDKNLPGLDAQRIAQVSLTHPDGEIVTIAKPDADATDYKLIAPAGDKTPKSAFELNNIATTLAHLVVDDVKPASEIPADAKAGVVAHVTTFDGSSLDVTTVEVAGQHYAKLSMDYQQSVASTAVAAAPSAEQPDATAAKTTETKPVDASQLKQAASDFNKKTSGWYYLIPSYQLGNFSKHSKDLLESAANTTTSPITNTTTPTITSTDATTSPEHANTVDESVETVPTQPVQDEKM